MRFFRLYFLMVRWRCLCTRLFDVYIPRRNPCDWKQWKCGLSRSPDFFKGKALTGATVIWRRKIQKRYLERYLLDGRLEISNNRAERSIKPFVIVRKDFLFANTLRGAKSSAVIFGIIETAKENRLKPYQYLTEIFRKAPNLDSQSGENAWKCLLPNSPNIQERCKLNAAIN